MHTKQVTRYSCDFCGKHGYSAPHMHRHEAHCTLNPNRLCRMCKVNVDEPLTTPDDLALAIAKLKRELGCGWVDAPGSMKQVWAEVVAKVHGCPACVLSVLRQAGIPVCSVSVWWRYTDECKAFWDRVNNDK